MTLGPCVMRKFVILRIPFNSLQQYEKAIDGLTGANRLQRDHDTTAETYRERASAYKSLGQIKKAKEDRAKAERSRHHWCPDVKTK